MYRLFDFCIDSEFALPGLLSCEGAAADWTVTLLGEEADCEGFERFHNWQDESGQDIMSVARRGATYLLEFVGLARFYIDFGARRVGARPMPGCADSTLAHLLLDQVFPRTVCHAGRPVLHASAVRLADGSAIAFAGVSGRGKSTLASAFYRAGYRLLSDDCLLIEECSGKVVAVPPYPSMRLWPDSADALFPVGRQHGLRASRMAHYTNKQVLRPEEAPAEVEPSGLRALFLLELPGPLRIEAARGMTIIMALLEAQFTLDVTGEEPVRRAFSAVHRVAGHVPVFRLTYPRDYGLLPEVIRAVLDAANRRRRTGIADA